MPREFVVTNGLHRKIYKVTVHDDGREIMEFLNVAEIEADPSQSLLVDIEYAHNKQLAREAITSFLHCAFEIDTQRNFLKRKFPRSVICPQDSPNWHIEWCSFCLGSKLCAEIYETYEEPSEEVAPRVPFLSIILYLNQHTLFKLFDHFHDWFLIVGMGKTLGRWIYAILACMKKPLPYRFADRLEVAYFDYVKHLEACNDKSERSRVYLFLGILDTHFGINLGQF